MNLFTSAPDPKSLDEHQVDELRAAHTRRARQNFGSLLMQAMQLRSERPVRVLLQVWNEELVRLVAALPPSWRPTPEPDDPAYNVLTAEQWARIQAAHARPRVSAQRFGQFVGNAACSAWPSGGATRRLFALSNAELVELVEAYAEGRPYHPPKPWTAMRELLAGLDAPCKCGHPLHEHRPTSGRCVIAHCSCDGYEKAGGGYAFAGA
ncbi:hypothetical protein [Polyangium sp. 15x6]|uniref:hypothetical protein n=1 Tax=Polyangium sp. 15x6 TaxID=3042687 RepID=UPI00249BF50F|nr:hypothetical protein [Polyangium sp. 15x6]MDI3285175.1 hypothetical protein [Polyangium sp. 15x6]